MSKKNEIDNKLFEDALPRLFSENYERVHKLALSLTYDEELSKDVTQITFMRAFEGLCKLKDKSKFSAWVRAIAANVSKDMLRQKISNRNRVISLYDEKGNIVNTIHKIADGNSIEEQYEKMEMIKDILIHINKLSLEEKQILYLKYYENYTYSEIAKHMKIKQSTVGMKLLRIKEKIANMIKRDICQL